MVELFSCFPDSPATEETPATAAKNETECIKASGVILGIHSDVIAEKHADEVKRGNKSMP